MTDADQRALEQAAAYRRQATITFADWLSRVRRGYYGPDSVKTTNWWKAIAALERVGQQPPPPPPPPLSSMAQNVIFCAENPLEALRSPKHYKVALSADPEYAQWATSAVVQMFRTDGRTVYSWCDCDATPASAGILMRDRLRLDGFIGQAETPDQYDNARNAGASIVVGNTSALLIAQVAEAKTLVNAGLLAFIGEAYANEGMAWPDTYDGRGINLASFCIGLYTGQNGYITVDAYKAHTPPGAWPGIGVYHAAGAQPGDLERLP